MTSRRGQLTGDVVSLDVYITTLHQCGLLCAPATLAPHGCHDAVTFGLSFYYVLLTLCDICALQLYGQFEHLHALRRINVGVLELVVIC